jgi:hypothetical protein
MTDDAPKIIPFGSTRADSTPAMEKQDHERVHDRRWL